MKAIDLILEHFEGNQTKAAKALGRSQQIVSYWVNNTKGTDMPLELVPKAARLIGKKPSELRPDIFGDVS